MTTTTIAAMTAAPMPHPVFCVVDGTHRDIAVAAEVVAGRVTVAGRTIAVGAHPDWTANPYPDDREWRVDWVKFYCGLDLAHAWQVTGDAAYVECWISLVSSYMAQVSPGHDATEVIARRIQNWIYTWNRFVDGRRASFDAAFAERLMAYLWQEVAVVEAQLSPERNHRTLELYALLVAAVACPDRDVDGRLQAFALAALRDNLLEDVRVDGVHREASTHYHCVALRSWLGTLTIARGLGVDLGSAFHDRLAAASAFAAAVHRPDGRIPALSDADGDSYLDVVGLAATLFEREDWRWVATAGRQGVAPQALDHEFPVGGYHLQRSGWTGDARYLLFDCGPLGDGGHGHYDLLNVEVFANQQPLITDPGRYTYSEIGERNWRHWFKGTRAHNTVTVDGLDQTTYSRRKPKGAIATGRLLARSTAPTLDLIVGEARTAGYDAVHTRTVLFVAREYWVVIDHLVAPTPHRYQLRWHLSPAASAAVDVDEGASRVRGHGVTLAIAQARRLQLEADWCSSSYGVKVPCTTVMVESSAYVTSFVTVIQPHAGGGDSLQVGWVSRGERPSERSVLEVCGVGQSGQLRDLITVSTQADFLELAAFRGVARAAWVRRDADERPLAFAALDVSSGRWREGGVATVVGREGDGGDRSDGSRETGGTGANAPTWLAWQDGRLTTGAMKEPHR